MLKKNSIIRSIILFLSGTILFWGVGSINLSLIEKNIVYKPSNQLFKLIPQLASKAEERSFLSKDGIKISYIRLKGNEKLPIILFCHGNSGNMTRDDNQNKIEFLVKQGYEVFTFDYRGFGKSSGDVDEKGLYKDLDAFISYLNTQYKIPANKIVLWGHSLGSAIVIDEASKKKFEGVITEGAFTSVEDMKNYRIAHKRNGNPVHLFIRDFLFNSMPVTQQFRSKDKITKIKSPMLIIHAQNDEMIPVEMGKKLAELKPDAQTYFSKVGHHCDYGWQNKPILEFLEKLH